MAEQKCLGSESRDVRLEDLKSRESERISTAEDIKALLEAEFRGIAEIQQSQKLTEEEFKLIENLYWQKVGQNLEGRSLYATAASTGAGHHRIGTDTYQNASIQNLQYRSLPPSTHTRNDEPYYSNSLRHEQKLKRHIIEEIVLEDSDKFYERTLNKKVKKNYKQNERYSDFLDRQGHYYNQEIFPIQTSNQNITIDNLVYHGSESNINSINVKKQTEYIVADGVEQNYETSTSYIVNKENLSSLPRDYKSIYSTQKKQNEILVDDIKVYKEKQAASTPLKMRNAFENEIEHARFEKQSNRKSRLEGTETKIRSNFKGSQKEIVLDDKLLFEETQIYVPKKTQKKPSYTTKYSAPKFKNKFRRSKKAKKSNYAYADDSQNDFVFVKTRENQEEIVLEHLDTFSDTNSNRKKAKVAQSRSLEKANQQLKAIEQDLYNQSLRNQTIEHKGPQKEIYLQGEEIVSETTLKKPKRFHFKKSPKLNADVMELSAKILESQQTENDNAVVLTNVVHKEPQYTYDEAKVVDKVGTDENFIVTEENKKVNKKSKKTDKIKNKKPFFKKRKVTSEIVIEDHEIFEDHNKPKKINLVHGRKVEDIDFRESLAFENYKDQEVPEKISKKEKKSKKLFKNDQQGETVVDKSFVYEDANKIALPSTSAVASAAQEEQAINHRDDSEKSGAIDGNFKPKINLNILNIQEEKILNDDYFVADDTKLSLTLNRTNEENRQENMESKKKNENEDKLNKFKVKLPDMNFGKKSKQSEANVAQETVQKGEQVDVDSNAVIEKVPADVQIVITQNGSEAIEEKKEEKTEETSTKKDEGKSKFKFHLPSFNKPTFKKSNADENQSVENAIKDEVKIEEAQVEDKNDESKKFKFHMPDIHLTKPSFKNKTFEEKVLIETPESNEQTQSINIQSNDSIGVENKEISKTVDIIQNDINEINNVNLPNIQINQETKSNEPKKCVPCLSENTTKINEEILAEKTKKEVINDKSLGDEITSNDVKQEKTGEKKFKFSFPHINIPKPAFGKKTKDKQSDENEVSVSVKPQSENIIDTDKIQITEAAKENKTEVSREIKENQTSENIVDATVNLPNVKINKPGLPPPPTFAKSEISTRSNDKIIDVNIPEPNQIVEKIVDMKPKVDIEKSNVQTIAKIEDPKVSILSEVDTKKKEGKKEVVIVAPAKEIIETIVESDDKTTAKKSKFSLPNFNISKPSFSFKKTKDSKNQSETATNQNEKDVSKKVQNGSTEKEKIEINNKITVQKDLKITPEVSVQKPELPIKIENIQLTKPQEVKSDNIKKEINIHETINSPAIISEKTNDKTDKDQKPDVILTNDIQKCVEIEKKENVEDDDKNKASSKKFKINFPTFAKKGKERPKDQKVDEEEKEEEVIDKPDVRIVLPEIETTSHDVDIKHTEISEIKKKQESVVITPSFTIVTEIPQSKEPGPSSIITKSATDEEPQTQPETLNDKPHVEVTKDGNIHSTKSQANKPTFMGKLRSNLPCIPKSNSQDESPGCLGIKSQDKTVAKTVCEENATEHSKHDETQSKENTLEKKKKLGLFGKLQNKISQKDTDDSTLNKKKKDKVFIVENDLSDDGSKGLFSKLKKKNKKTANDKQDELIVVGDARVTESVQLSSEGDGDKDEARLSAFLQDQSASKNNIVLDANNKPVFNQNTSLENDKAVENVQVATSDVDKSKLLLDNSGNETLISASIKEGTQSGVPIRPTYTPLQQSQQTTSKNSYVTQSPSKKSPFFNTIAPVSQDDKKPLQFVVVAIDFGTTFSGYAFSFNRDIDSIHVMRKWEGGDPGVTNQKTPTTLLLDPTGKFHSFGFTARDFYHDLSPKEAQKWMYFEKFKMTLHYNADLTSDTEIKAANGKSYKALDVFSHALKFFRNHAIQEIGEQSNTPIYEDDIKWVITVPAIWKSPAKQFMREAAYKAGIASAEKAERLLIALEPEAASVFVRKQRLKQLLPESADRIKDSQDLTPPENVENIAYHAGGDDTSSHNQSLSSAVLNQSFQRSPSPTSFPVSVGQEVDITDNRFMVADCGGGTADITVYEMLSATGGKLKELYKASGGPFGSIGVDLEFEKLLVSVFTLDFIEAFKLKRPAGWVDLMLAFESRKRAANPFKSKPLNVPLPFSFIDYHKKHKSSTVEAAIKKYNNKNVLWSSQGMLRLLPEAMDKLFQPTIDAIVKAVREVINQPDVQGVHNIFMVGGFSESPMLQQAIRKNFANQSRILIPNDVSLTILKGAVLFGIDPSVVVIRKSRLTYGLGVLNKFIESKHPEEKKAMKDGEAWCVDVFDPLVFADQSVALGSSVIRSYTPASANQKFSLFHIYCSEDRNVDFVSEEGVAKCGTLRLDLDDHQWELESSPSRPASQQISSQNAVEEEVRREIQARLTFGDTEIKLIALDVATGNYVRATLDFLNK